MPDSLQLFSVSDEIIQITIRICREMKHMAETQPVKLAEGIFEAVCSKGKERTASLSGRNREMDGTILGSKQKPHKMRLVLPERPSPEQNTGPEWYKRMVDRRKELENYLWKDEFYEMGLMGRETFMDLMDNIAGNQALTERNRQDIYERDCSFHHQGEGGSPLYTILTTDSFLNGIPLRFLDTNKLMEYVLNRDEETCAGAH